MLLCIAIITNVAIKLALWKDKIRSKGRRNVFAMQKKGSMEFKITYFVLSLLLAAIVSLSIVGYFGNFGPWVARLCLSVITGIILPALVTLSKPKMRSMVTTTIKQNWDMYKPLNNRKINPS